MRSSAGSLATNAEEAQPLPLGAVALLGAALILSLGTALSLGFGRFAYALLLVPMQADLAWTYAQSGLINSANALGYLRGVLALPAALSRLGPPNTVRIGMWMGALSLLGTGLTEDFTLLLLLRVLSGLGAGLVFIGGAPLVVQLGAARSTNLPLTIYYSGPGLGMLIAGLLIPVLLVAPQLGGWQLPWIAMGIIGIISTLLMEWPIRAAARRGAGKAGGRPPRQIVLDDYRRLWPTIVAFTFFGLGYIGYMTFIVAYIAEAGAAAGLVQAFFIVLALATIAGGPLWGVLMNRFNARDTLLLILLLLTVGALLPVFVTAAWSYVLSAILFGGSFLALISAITRQVRQVSPADRWPTVMSIVTAIFATGQLIGPVLTGAVADLPGGLWLGLAGSGAVLALAMLTILLGPTPKPAE